MLRRTYIERVRRMIYGGQPSDDASITVGMVNNVLPDAIANAAKANYLDNTKLEGISYVNNSFYTVFKGLSVSVDETNLYKITLPEIPLGIGNSDGVSTVIFKDSSSTQLSYPIVMMSENQRSYSRGMRAIPNKILAYQQGSYIYVSSTIILSDYTAQVTMVSGGDATNLDSILNVPPDYFEIMDKYLLQKFLTALSVKKDDVNDGMDNTNPTA